MNNYIDCSNCDKYEITINWIRHGESCSNLDQKINMDKKNINHVQDLNNDDLDVKLDNFYQDKKKDDEYEHIDDDIDDDIGDIGDDIGDDIDDSDFEDIDFNKEISNKNQSSTLLNSIYETIKNKSTIIKAGFLYEPNLSFIGMNQAINLGTNFFYKNNDPRNIYISSPLTRTITTAMLSLRFIENAVIYVVPYINEKSNVASKFNIDYQNTAVPSNLLKKKIFFIKEWLNKFWIGKFDDIEIRNFLKNIYLITNNEEFKKYIYDIFDERRNKKQNKLFDFNKIQEFINNLICDNTFLESLDKNNHVIYEKIIQTLNTLKEYKNKFDKFKKGPVVNFEIYEYYENLKKNIQYKDILPDLKYTNTDFFYTNVLNVILRDVEFNTQSNSYPQHLKLTNNKQQYAGVKIFAFAHGSLIRSIWEKFNPETYIQHKHELVEMMNTAIITDKITIYNQSHIIYHHKFTINDYVPVKLRTYDALNFESQNENICDKKSVKGIINYFLNDKELIDKYKDNPDIQFYVENKEKINNDNLPSQFAGSNIDKYKNKYIKYKNKYIHLKNNML